MAILGALFSITTLVAASSVWAAPITGNPIKGNGATFSLPLARDENYEKPSGLQAMLWAHAKFGAPLSPQLKRAARADTWFSRQGRRQQPWNDTVASATAALPAGYDFDFEYITPVNIGTPPQTLPIILDTGSSEFFVFSTDTPKRSLSGQPVYDPANSTTSHLKPGYTWSAAYGDGSKASGIVYNDRVSLGTPGGSGGEVWVPNHAVQSPQRISASLGFDGAASGLMGLGMSSGNRVAPQSQKTFVDSAQHALREPLFTADLRAGRTGRYDFGFVDASAYTGEMAYVPVSQSSTWWMFRADGYEVGSGGWGGGGSGFVRWPWEAMVDTGTSLLLMPKEIVEAYYGRVDGAAFDRSQGVMVFPCGSALPDWSFGIGSYRGVVPGRYMMYQRRNKTHCFGGMQSSENIGFSIFGDIVLKAQFVVFDLGGMRLGWANKNLTDDA